MKTNLKTLKLKQETVRHLTVAPTGSPAAAQKPAFTTGLHCKETNFITCAQAFEPKA